MGLYPAIRYDNKNGLCVVTRLIHLHNMKWHNHDATHFIAGAVNYFECSSLEGTGLDNIVQTAISIALTKPTRRMFNWPWKRCVSHDIM